MIGDAWHLDDPAKPWADWDPQANIVIPIGVDEWLAELATTYLSHEITATAPLECDEQGVYLAGTIPVRMKLVASPTFQAGKKYPFTIRIHGADGKTQDDRTLWLKVKDR